ncbi:rhomboid-domain-containing protein [Apiospora marii]|uniref:Rhomboid-domain-containing protein n=1 Tax=Apiospora marii TaxID=335849 RepID=A0ABR1QZJ1_9PEZI
MGLHHYNVPREPRVHLPQRHFATRLGRHPSIQGADGLRHHVEFRIHGVFGQRPHHPAATLHLARLRAAVLRSGSWLGHREFGGKVRVFKKHWTCSLETLEKGRYHTLLLTVFCHDHLGHILGTLIFAPPISGLFKPWSVVLLAAGSELSSNLGFVGESWLALRASPGPDDATERDTDRRIRRRHCLGASGMVFGVTAALTCLSPTARIFRFIPLWFLVPSLVVNDIWDGYGTPQGLRARYRTELEAEKTGVAFSGSKVDSAANLAGAAFGVLFALVKRRLGFRL